MLRVFALAAQAGLLALAGYNAVVALWGWPDPRPAPPGTRQRKLRVVIPAHDEEKVIGSILTDLNRSDYPNREVWVLADRCTDSTTGIATDSGARVTERETGPPGKGAALAWYLSRHPLEPDEVLVVFDADNRVPPSILTRIADEMDLGHQVVQCYLDVANPDSSLLAEASALSYWAGNRMVQLARSNLGWSADLGGTGMAFTKEALDDAGGFAESLTEDQDLGVRLLLAGHRVGWLHDARIRDEKPAALTVTARQRARWMAGKRTVARRYLRPLLQQPSPARLDMVLRLVQPGRSFIALLSGLAALAAVGTGSPWLLPWQVWGAAAAVQVLEPIPFLAKEGVEPRRLLRYPVLGLLAALWVPVRILSHRTNRWYHTPHVGSSREDEAPVVDP